MKAKKNILSALLAAVMLTGCANTTIEMESEQSSEPASEVIQPTAEVTEPVSEPEPEPEPEPQPVSITFTAIGDNLIHAPIYRQAAARSQDGTYDFAYAYEGAADLIGGADITVMNQETLICGDEYQPSTYPMFNSPTQLGEYMSQLGVDVFTIANNHCLDKGEQGLSDCLDWYDEHGYTRVGAYKNSEDRANIRTIEIDGVTVSFLCYTEYLNGLSLPAGSDLEIGMAFEYDTIKEEIRAAKEISDICVLSLHWGTENSWVTEDYQRQLAAEYGEAGADVIIGTHPHVLRGIEMIENSDGRKTLCAYSLGNFISAQDAWHNLIGGTLDFTVSFMPGEDGIPEISDVVFNPIVTHYESNWSDVRLYKLQDYTPELAAVHGTRAFSSFNIDMINEFLHDQGLDEYMR